MSHQTISSFDDPKLVSILALLGEGEVNGWFENEFEFDGLKLLDKIEANDAISLIAKWSVGRLFTDLADIRWERGSNSALYLVVVAECAGAMPGESVVELTSVGKPHELILWGRQNGGGFEERRIANLARCYPDHWKGPYAAIRVKTYEADWPGNDPERASIRTITRYLGYESTYEPRNFR